MGFIINDAKKNDVIKTSPVEANREEATSDIYLGESNKGQKNGEQFPGGNGLVPLSDADTPGGDEPAVGSEDYVVLNHGNEKEQPCADSQTDNLETEETTVNCSASPEEHAHWSGNKGSEREAFVDETEVSNREGEEGEQPSAQPTRLTEAKQLLEPLVSLMSPSNPVYPPTVPMQQLPCDKGSDINPKVEQNNLEPTGEGGMHSFGSGKVDVIHTHEGGVKCNYEGSHSGDGHSGDGRSDVLISTIEQQQSSFSLQSNLNNPKESSVSKQDGGRSESIPTTNMQTSICSADVSASCGGEQGVTVMALPLESNPLEPNGANGMAPQGVGKVDCANGEVSSQGEVPGGVAGHIAGGVSGHLDGEASGHLDGGASGNLDGEPPRRKHALSSDQKPTSSAHSDDVDESNHIIKKKIKKKVEENDKLFYAINEFMKEGLKNECIPLFERLQQNLFFLVMLANIPNENFDELESSSSDY